MSAVVRRLGAVLLGVLATSCFSGEGTLGGACERSSDCGSDQSCERSVCSLCGDGVAQAGEVCLDTAALSLELQLTQSPASAPQAIDLDGNGRKDLVWASEDGLGFAFADAEGFAEPQWVGSATGASWVGAGAGGWPLVLSRDAAGATILWRPEVGGVLSTGGAVVLDALQNIRAALLTEQLGVVAAIGEVLYLVDPAAPDAPAQELAIGAETRELLGPLDLDGDGFDDLYVWTASGDFIAVHGRGDEAPVLGERFELKSPPYDVVATAWNRDTHTDLVVLGQDRTVRVLLAPEVGSAEMTEVQSVSVAADARHLLVADLNADTDPDVLIYGPEAGPMWALIGRGADLDSPVVLEADGNATWVGAFPVGSDPFNDLLRLRDGAFDLFEGNP